MWSEKRCITRDCIIVGEVVESRGRMKRGREGGRESESQDRLQPDTVVVVRRGEQEEWGKQCRDQKMEEKSSPYDALITWRLFLGSDTETTLSPMHCTPYHPQYASGTPSSPQPRRIDQRAPAVLSCRDMRPSHCRMADDDDGDDESPPATPPSQLELADASASMAARKREERGKLLLRGTAAGRSMERSPFCL